MLKKTITYVDYNDEQRTEDFYFNLNKAELVEMEVSVDGGMQKKLEDIVHANDAREVLKVLKEIILLSYGEKSNDGAKFRKSKEISNDFASMEAFSELYMELISDEKAAAAFINGIMPRDIAEEIAKHPDMMALER